MVWRDERGNLCDPPQSRMDWTAPEFDGSTRTDRDAVFRGVYDPGLGVRLSGRDHRRKIMAQKNLVEIG